MAAGPKLLQLYRDAGNPKPMCEVGLRLRSPVSLTILENFRRNGLNVFPPD
jgi:hypothetical protein